MEKQILIMKLIDDLLALSDDGYREAKAYWKANPPEGENLIIFLIELFAYTDMKRSGGIENADA